jgi:hypothetical protein
MFPLTSLVILALVLLFGALTFLPLWASSRSADEEH